MITKIKKIKGLGIFSDFTWVTGLHDFGRYNLIYGWNGSGKTTLSNFFAGLPAGSVDGWGDLEYEIETVGGIVKNGQGLLTKIRVFNRDYVSNNVHTISGKAKPILILGEENKKIADEIAADEEVLVKKSEQIKKINDESEGLVTQKDKIFSDIAKTIGLNTSGLATRNYRKPNAEADFVALTEKLVLEEDEVAEKTFELKQMEKGEVPEIVKPRLTLDGEEKDLGDFLNVIVTTGATLSAHTVESKLIDRLRLNSDISQWVENGIELHKRHASQKCEFCDQVLPPRRMEVFAAHFNEADKILKDEINTLMKLVDETEVVIRGLGAPDKANLYDELQGEYQTAVDKFVLSKTALLGHLNSFRVLLETKKAKTTESISLGATLDGSAVIAGIDNMNTEVRKHNIKTTNFKVAKEVAQKKLETHYLSTIYDDVKTLELKIIKNNEELEKIKNGDKEILNDVGITELSERIRASRAKISSTHKGCKEINAALKTFLGRDELQFEVEAEGYILMRGKKFAENLSEGEKTAIGFVHFVIHLKDQGFDPSKGIVVVDDPVSSLDSNSTFQAFAFLKNSVKDAEQVFLLTHNFDFLRLLINWLNHEKRSKQKVGYYMIKNVYDTAGERTALIDTLDELLQKHESEYHYLFKRLYTFESNGTIESVYNVPNIARKVLDTFLMFRVPNGDSPFTKLESLKPYFDENKLTSIYKFTNDQSHITGKGFDPSLVVETQKNVSYLLEMIATVFPEHHKILIESITSK